MRKEFETEVKQITPEELIEVRKDEMQSMLPNLFTKVGEHVIKSKEITVRGGKR